GLKIALDNIDEVIKLIRAAKTDVEAKTNLMERFGLDDVQSQAILEMRLRRLTGLAREDVENHLDELHKLIDELRSILASEEKVLNIIKEEMTEIKNRFADERRTHIDMTAIDYIEDESLIPNEDVMIALTHNGYIKRTTSDTFKAQNRGGVGIKGMATNEEDFVEHMINIETHDDVLFFTNKGKVYRLRGYEIPEFSRQSKGLPVVNLIQVEKEEKVNSIIKINRDKVDEISNLLFVTKSGLVKRTALEEFKNIRQSGKICITLKEDDELIAVMKTSGDDLVLLGSSNGRMCKFNENEVRVMGRTASGVKGIELDDASCIGAAIATEEDTVLIVTKKGYGKQTKVSEYRETKRGSKGVKALSVTDKNGYIASFRIVRPDTDLVIITDGGMVMRMPLGQINVLGRVTQGVRLINLKDESQVASISLVDKEKEEEELPVEDEVINNEEIDNQQSVDLGNNQIEENAEDMPQEEDSEAVIDDLDMDLDEEKSEFDEDEI
ncbi:MAG: DNA gyrase subunit A, partial [Bacilli bacterium]|nr:DNA gyrase subunit A [Bacilli bacterium]